MSELDALRIRRRARCFPRHRDAWLPGPVENPSGPPLNDVPQKLRSKTFRFLRSLRALTNLGYGERACETARRQRCTNLVDLASASLRAAGHDPNSYSGCDQMLKAAFTTISLPNTLSQVTERTLVSAYEETASDWKKFCHVDSAENFKTQSGTRPAALPNLEEIGPGGQIKHTKFGEEATYNWSVRTYAKMLSITRKTMIDDDLGFVDQLAPMMGTAAGRSLLDLIWATIMGGEAANFFSVANGNLLSASSILAVASLGTAVAAMKNQTDSQGNSIGVVPVARPWPAERGRVFKWELMA